MPFLGNTPSQGFTNSVTKDDFTPNGSTTAFTLSKASNTNNIEVYVGNVRQEPTSSYSVSGTTLTMTEAPATGTNFYVMHESGSSAISLTPAAGTSVPGAFGVSGALTAGSAGVTGALTAASAGVTGNATVGGTLVNTGLITASAGVAIGGTGSANTLDDYEEGTFTAVVTMGSGTATVSSSVNTLYYTKVGRLCTVGGQFQLSAVSNPSGSFALTLPFAADSNAQLSAGTYRTYSVDTPNDGTSNVMYSDNNTAVFQWSRDSASSTNENATSGGYYMIGLTYFTA